MKEPELSEHSGAVVKKKTSSGCLIVQKMAVDGGFSDSPTKERKRPRLVLPDSESNDELDKGSVACKRGFVEIGGFEPEKRVDNGLDDPHLSPPGLNEKNNGESFVEPLKLQGQNGVLKVMANKHGPMAVSSANADHAEVKDRIEPKPDKKKKIVPSRIRDGKDRQGSRSRDANKKTAEIRRSFDSDHPSVKGNESKVKRGSVTEKQLVREKIRKMLLAAGWTIDYRPRKNRDYLDAVYVNPSGSGYWSITKAYEALQKEKENQKEEEDGSKVGGDFTPLPDEILSKLTRQTQKKLERETKKKRRDEGNRRKDKRARMKGDTDGDQREKKLSSQTKHRRKPMEKASGDHFEGLNGDSDKETPKKDRAAKTIVRADSHMVQGIKSRRFGRCTLLVRSSDTGLNSENDGFAPSLRKRTVLSWLVDSGTVCVGGKVQYMNLRRSKVMQEGWVTKDGIHCGCCSKIVTVSRFELHAGSLLRQPSQNIFIQSGKSLMQCQIDAWNMQGELERKGFHEVDVDGGDPNDDTCGLCGDGGDLICCDGCPSTFHQSCLDLQMLPQGDWHCPNCTCRYCDKPSGRTESELLVCRLCESKYHEPCSLKTSDMPTDPNIPFCGQRCQELYSHLQKLLGVKHELDSGLSWSLIHRSHLISDTSSVKFPQRVECNSKLAVALSVMDECFLPITDRRSGINLIHNVVYNCGSNISRLNYSGFFTAILEMGDEMVCAASIRIHGTQLAEMPFIGTRDIYRRQGMCRRLLDAIESVLSSFQVEKLIIPTIAEHMHTWRDAFGFSPLEESDRREMRSTNVLAFPGTEMLQKRLLLKQGKTSVQMEVNKRSDLCCPDVKDFSSEAPSIHLNDNYSVDATKETVSMGSHIEEEISVQDGNGATAADASQAPDIALLI